MEIQDISARVQCPKCGFELALNKIYGPRLGQLEVLYLTVRDMAMGEVFMPLEMAERLGAIMEILGGGQEIPKNKG